MRRHRITCDYERSSWGALKLPALAPVQDLLGFRFEYCETFQAIVGAIGYPMDRTIRYSSQPVIDITLELKLAPPSSVFIDHSYELFQFEALTVFAMLMVEI